VYLAAGGEVKLRASCGKQHLANITKEWDGDFAGFVKSMAKVAVTDDKASAGWVCGVHFKPAYRHSENFQGRYFLSLDYDKIEPTDVQRILDGVCASHSFLAYTTWSHTPEHPRLRVWIPLSRAASQDEFQAVSRRIAARVDIELAARESHTPCQLMFRPAHREGHPFQQWSDTSSPYLDVDAVLAEYDDWQDKSQWPRRKENDELYDSQAAESPLTKEGLVGDFCRTWRISEAIERFQLPYEGGSLDGRWTYTGGSRADGAVAYDDDTKLHSYHDTDPARGQNNAYDLTRLHYFGAQDAFDDPDMPIAERPSTRAMEAFCRELPEMQEFFSAGFTSLEHAPPPPPIVPDELPDEITQARERFTDLSNARRIQRVYSRQVIAVASKFYVWQETHWKFDAHEGQIAKTISNLADLVREELVSLRSKFGEPDEAQQKILKEYSKFAAKCENKTTMDACRGILRELLDYPAEKLNSHRRLLNTRTCTIDLETGETHKHNPRDFLTACAPTDYDPEAACPEFDKFMLEIFDYDADMVGFMKRWLGYCITGETREQAFIFHVGRAGNGKSTLMRVLTHVLGSGYAMSGPKTLLTGKGGETRNDVASLIGKRLVTLSETKQNEEFDQSQLKELSGGDRLSVRFLYKEFFEFDPTHKIQIFTNYEPSFTGDDPGIWRRVLLVRYPVRFGTAEQVASGEYQKLRNDKLEDILKLEAPGILRWLIEGAREWYVSGLRPPVKVHRATKDLREQQDLIGQFLKERTVRDPKGRVPYSNATDSLYSAYKGWVVENGQKPLGRNKFLRQIRDALVSVEHDFSWMEGQGEWRTGIRGIRLANGKDLGDVSA
jgi:P4 family phage/plasmid primase-like protien